MVDGRIEIDADFQAYAEEIAEQVVGLNPEQLDAVFGEPNPITTGQYAWFRSDQQDAGDASDAVEDWAYEGPGGLLYLSSVLESRWLKSNGNETWREMTDEEIDSTPVEEIVIYQPKEVLQAV